MRNRTRTTWLFLSTSFFAIGIVILLAGIAGATKAQSGNLMFILDGSGSMWGQVEGKAKITIAKDVLSGLIEDLPQGLNVGLVAYGHRRKGDCNDVEELVALRVLDKAVLIKKIKDLSPKGKTPITLSVKLTAEKLKTLEDETTIILVSDGKETCEGDPCALVKELKQSGARFVMHVIGFDVTDEERKQLECIAEAGGGMYYAAKSAGDFQMAAKQVVQETQTVGFLKLTALRNRKAVKAHIEVFIPEKETRVKTATSSTNIEKPVTIRLKPGVYTIRVTDNGLQGKPSVTFPGIQIEVGKTVEKTAEFSASYLKVMATKEGKPFKARVYVYRQGETNRLDYQNAQKDKPASFKLLPGLYDIKVTDDSVPDKPVVNFKGIEIKPGETLEKSAEFSREGLLEVTALKEGKPFKAWVYVFRQGEKSRLAYQNAQKDKPASFKLLPGFYDIKVTDDSVLGKPVVNFKGVEIKPGETLEKSAEFSREGLLEVTALKEGKPFKAWVYVFRQGEKSRLAYQNAQKDKPASFKLLPGFYDIKVTDDSVLGKPVVNFKGVEIKPGETLEKSAEFSREGLLEVTALKEGKPFKAWVYVFRQGEKSRLDYQNAQKDKPASFKLLPGLYDIQVTDDSVLGKPVVNFKGVEIQSGETLEKMAEFTPEGILEVTAVQGGNPFKANVYVYPQGEKNRLGYENSYKNRPAVFKLLPGLYDIKVNKTSDKSVKELKGVTIESGKTKTIEAVF